MAISKFRDAASKWSSLNYRNYQDKRNQKYKSKFAKNRKFLTMKKTFRKAPYKSKSWKKMPYKSRITFPTQEKFLRSRVVSRKFKFTTIEKLIQDKNYLINYDTLLKIVEASKFIGHIAEYEDFAISYIKMKAKIVNGTSTSFIADYTITKDQAASMIGSEVVTRLFPKYDIGNVTTVRKQNLLAAHKKARTSPWVKTKDMIDRGAKDLSTILFPSTPSISVAPLDPKSPCLIVCEVSLYCVTKNRLVETTNLRTELIEMNVLDKAQELVISANKRDIMISRPTDALDPPGTVEMEME